MLFALVEGTLKSTKRKLTMRDFGDIARRMTDFFAGKTVQIGERLTSHRNPNIIKRSSVQREMAERRNGHCLHSYVTKAVMYGARYDLLCRRVLGGEAVVIQEELDEEAEREPMEDMRWYSDEDEEED
jgi:hypothetical protein